MKRLILVSVLALLAAGCASEEPTTASGDLAIESDAFETGRTLPARYTCDGDDVAPPLGWGTVPDAEEFVITLTDPDAGGFTHWILYSIPAGTTALDEDEVPADAIEGTNDYDDRGYRGPCPPPEDGAHEYVFSVYALDARPDLEEGADLATVLDAIDPSIIASGTLRATYDR